MKQLYKLVVKIKKQVIGAAGSIAGDIAWQAWPGHTAFALLLEQSPLAFIDHYHWALALLAFDNPYADGAGLTLLALEFTHKPPFGLGEPGTSLNLTLSAFLTGIVLIRRLK